MSIFATCWMRHAICCCHFDQLLSSHWYEIVPFFGGHLHHALDPSPCLILSSLLTILLYFAFAACPNTLRRFSAFKWPIYETWQLSSLLLWLLRLRMSVTEATAVVVCVLTFKQFKKERYRDSLFLLVLLLTLWTLIYLTRFMHRVLHFKTPYFF